MTQKRRKRLVIDASVGGSAGSASDHPRSKACRLFLQEVQAQTLKLAMSVPLRQEWRAHQSVFATKWLTSMFARRLVDDLGDPQNIALRQQLESCARQGNGPITERDAIAAAMNKDAHLLEAALASDKSVVSLDETVRGHFCRCTVRIPQLRILTWINPTRASETPIRWLTSGAPDERSRKLG